MIINNLQFRYLKNAIKIWPLIYTKIKTIHTYTTQILTLILLKELLEELF